MISSHASASSYPRQPWFHCKPREISSRNARSTSFQSHSAFHFVNLQNSLSRRARKAQHVNVRAGAKNPVSRRDHNRSNFRMFKSDSLQGVVQFDIHSQVVRIQLQLVPRTDPTVSATSIVSVATGPST